jgi:SAM-dependent methyltransferase
MQLRDLTGVRSVRPASLLGHLDTAASVRRYQRKADDILRVLHSGRLLDWGSFYGQMTFLLSRRGLDVVPFDVEENRLDRTLADLVGRQTVYSRELVGLPFESGSFDAVLSCGTLEHVADPSASLTEVRRVLKPQGRFLIYNLPNSYSWIEAINGFRGVAHERRYTLRGARRWLSANGFAVNRAEYENVLPCSFSSLRTSRAVLVPIANVLRAIDPWLERLPISRLVSTNLTLICTRR